MLLWDDDDMSDDGDDGLDDDADEDFNYSDDGEGNPYGSDPEDENEKSQEKPEEEKQEETTEDSEKSKKKKQEKFKNMANQYGFPAISISKHCPECHERSLFLDKPVPTGIRVTKLITQAIICAGAVNLEKVIQITRYVCLNPNCKCFWPNTGYKFKKTADGGKLIKEMHPFHISR